MKHIVTSTLTAFFGTMLVINLIALFAYGLTCAGDIYAPSLGLVMLIMNGVGLVVALVAACAAFDEAKVWEEGRTAHARAKLSRLD